MKFKDIKLGESICVFCIGLYLLLIFFNRDLARVGFYLLAILGLYAAYREIIHCHKHEITKYAILFSCFAFALYGIVFFLGKSGIIGDKLLLHLIIIFPFFLLNSVFEGWVRILLNISILIVLSGIISYVYSDYSLESVKYFEDHYDLYLLLAPIIYVVYKNRISLHVLRIIFILSCVFSGLSLIFDFFNVTNSTLWIFDNYRFDIPRFGANIHPIQFATLVASMMVVTFSIIVSNANRSDIGILSLGIVGVVFALSALYASGTRGVWISIPVVVVIMILNNLKTMRNKILSILGCVLLALFLVQAPGIKDRFTLAVSEVDDYLSSEHVNDSVRRTSVGVRLEMWKISWEVFQANPIVGVGPGVLSRYMQDQGYSKTGKYDQAVVKHRNPHNMYIKALTDRGIVGLVLVILVLFVPMIIFMNSTGSSRSKELRGYALSGVFIVIIFSISGLTIGALDNRQTSMCYIFFIGLLSGLLLKEKNKQDLNVSC